MDTGEGRFVKATDLEELLDLKKKYPKSKGIFQEGEKIEIKGSSFVISKIIQNGLKLRLLQ